MITSSLNGTSALLFDPGSTGMICGNHLTAAPRRLVFPIIISPAMVASLLALDSFSVCMGVMFSQLFLVSGHAFLGYIVLEYCCVIIHTHL